MRCWAYRCFCCWTGCGGRREEKESGTIRPSAVSNWDEMPLRTKWVRVFARRAAILLATIFLSFLALLVELRPNSAREDEEQYLVFSDYLSQGLTGESHSLGDRAGMVVIDGSSRGGWRRSLFLIATFSHARQNSRLSSFVPLVNLLTSNVRSEKFQKSFVLPARYELMTESETKLCPYEAFWKRFPGNYGYHTFTRIGFNRDLTEAMFYTDHMCGLCGEGKYVYMRKQNGKWVVIGTASTWVS